MYDQWDPSTRNERTSFRVGGERIRSDEDHDPFDQAPDGADPTGHQRDGDRGDPDAGVPEVETVPPEPAEEDPENPRRRAGLERWAAGLSGVALLDGVTRLC